MDFGTVCFFEKLRIFGHNIKDSFLTYEHRGVGNCIILLTSGDETQTDTFMLVDVVVKAEQIIRECPGKSKKSLGGLATIGHQRHFFVAVNGPG